MNTDQHGSAEGRDEEFLHAMVTEKVIGVFYDVYNELGCGFLESVYHRSMLVALRQAGLEVDSRVPIPVFFRGEPVGDFEADLVVEGRVIVELKAARMLDPAHETQLLNYLRATPIEVGLLLNFGTKPQMRRLIFDNPRKQSRGRPD